MTEPLLQVKGLVKRFGGLVATNNLDLDVQPGETLALIGPNGAGKTSLISQLQGDLTPDEGTIRFGGRDITAEPAHRRARIGLARSFQITSVFPEFSLLGNVAVAIQARIGHSFRFWRSVHHDPALTAPARAALDVVGLSQPERRAADVSHGERRQLELAMALAMQPRLLLLDEPMAGMGREDSARMTRLLSNLKRDYAILLVEHDMNAVFALADRVTVLVAGQAIASGSADTVRADPRVRAAYLGKK
ncbi:ABC transporter ATP-binding protein [Bradyrhizobium sp. U87765 SZCCT0131]|uniref:ABC transporter ATP-binding protein n=1 Tax=unclassified Bradyrhizobium TaxID=2631580 RepID=UPI001BAA567C|nr:MULTISPECIES: ABC transporter ATP-binding protein [unclassified Bradyrhizobium]MBR1221361.1 ABC transporter ATP-binding protein [Bradyrhizobium sp. U87765 SZCCT0131]MBR1264716.1 ABC transporter ATP-binding protein [Bradyrhizobium sp. U87765 SZCCT0134]MBR1304378.1 ABC transporter ATP-binding protein [Bradyrhizobium sp. U87765 SZCCT0110]MBR1322765.1 ABC transporter ATP-binding protein [Bradyrhizobium sp. U87765 SZCCT0109]MBR1346307.1 ABC transporter ATP-binding protein [Bradyrhizobium sp. U87